MSAYDERHRAQCEVCRSAVAAPRPFDPDLCHFDIHPDESGEPFVQCPHLAVPGSSRLCAGHLDAAVRQYVQLVQRTAGLN